MTGASEKKITPKAIIGFMGHLFLHPFVLFVNARTVDWPVAWILFGLFIPVVVGTRILVYKKNPDLIEERASYKDSGNVKSWDKILVPLAAFIFPVIIFFIAGQDKYFHWTNSIPLWAQIAAIIIAFLGLLISSWAMLENRFFSTMVRIQNDRGHTVCDSGPYKMTRHPGYTGGILYYLMTPLVLDSLWAFIPAGLATAFIIIRTAMEDKTLRLELAGYEEYTRKTRYRLLPGIW
ncbi:MAG: isoprenylcysteine carboxylmethyltransferase family protein [Spirochaetales bacterium]|nr:isoprenylcysteine carboxylmethyltransferase family protein [Spirochaetales bacterium]